MITTSKSLIGFNGYMLENEDDQNTPITVFTEDQGIKTTPDEIYEAEEEEKEENENEDADNIPEDELNSMSLDDLKHIRCFPEYQAYRYTTFEYGTPAGIDTRGCPSCGDAADAVITDAEVSPADDSDEGTNELPTEEVMQLYKYCYSNTTLLPKSKLMEGVEDFSEISNFIVHALGKLFSATANVSKRAFRFIRNVLSKRLLKLETYIHRWEIKIKDNLTSIDNQTLSKYEVEAFTLQRWIELVKFSITLYTFTAHIKNYVFDPNTTALTSKFTQFTNSLRRVNISFNLEKNKANMTELLNERRFLPVTSLGYTRENINRVFNYLYEISEYIPKNEDSDPLKIIIKSISDDIEKMSIDLNQELTNNKIKEGSPIYKKKLARITACTMRFNFAVLCMKTVYQLFDILIDDALHIFSKYEKALDES